ncbi:MAG: glycosyltransferase [Polyangiaceae bacterium]
MKVVLLVPSLVRGGAERQLVMTARGLQSVGVDVTVMVFYDGGAFERDILESGIRLVSLRKSHRWDLAGFGVRFLRALHAEKPDILYSFMATSNLLGVAAGKLKRHMQVVWGIRSARQSLADYDWLTRTVARMETMLSAHCDVAIVNSKAGRRFLLDRGFPETTVVYIPNGIDVDRYTPDPDGGQQLRAKWGVGRDQYLVGIVARADPVKAHEVFMAAARLLAANDTRLHFVCVGIDDATAERLTTSARDTGIAHRFLTKGPRDDLCAVYSALDVHVMCSHSEGFPNVVAEAMACRVPCVVTDVGDAREIVGDTGSVVPAGAPSALAEAIRLLLARTEVDRKALGTRARARVVKEFSLEALTTRTVAQFERAMKKPAPRRT